MTWLKRNIVILICCNFMLFSSCGNRNDLTEVGIPERETFITKKSDFPDPATIKTKQGPFEMLGLQYTFDELEPLFKPETAFSHYDKVHLDYANKLNSAVHGTAFEKDEINTLVTRIDTKSANLKNLAGGYNNHNILWRSISPVGQSKPNDALSKLITESFGSLLALQKELITKGNSLVGSGWLWITILPNGKLTVVTTSNNDNPSMPELQMGKPLFCIDLWEHAYYDTYQNDKTSYIETSFKYFNWNYANTQFTVEVE